MSAHIGNVDIADLTLSDLADVIARDWQNVYFGAVPYLQAMRYLGDITDSYGYDSGADVVAYFLSNARGWKGSVARQVKTELRRRLESVR